MFVPIFHLLLNYLNLLCLTESSHSLEVWRIKISMSMFLLMSQSTLLTLLHSEWPKLQAFLSAVGLSLSLEIKSVSKQLADFWFITVISVFRVTILRGHLSLAATYLGSCGPKKSTNDPTLRGFIVPFCKLWRQVWLYSITCLKGPPKGGTKTCCLRQVALYRFIFTVFWFKGPRKCGCLRQVVQ